MNHTTRGPCRFSPTVVMRSWLACPLSARRRWWTTLCPWCATARPGLPDLPGGEDPSRGAQATRKFMMVNSGNDLTTEKLVERILPEDILTMKRETKRKKPKKLLLMKLYMKTKDGQWFISLYVYKVCTGVRSTLYNVLHPSDKRNDLI